MSHHILSSLSIYGGTGFSTSADTKIHGHSSPLYKNDIVLYLHITYTHPPIYFKAPLDYL